MKRLNNKSMIIMTTNELDNIADFIRDSLHQQWDRHTDNFICSDKWEDGMRRMNPDMYDLAEQIRKTLY